MGVDVHLYGVPGWTPSDRFGMVHDHDELRESWFTACEHPRDVVPDALLTVETGPNEWEGFRTYRPGS